MAFPPLDVTAHWRDLNDHLVELVDVVPDDRLDWTPEPGMWGCRHLFLHIAAARHHWLNVSVRDGDHVGNRQQEAATANKPELQAELLGSWERLERFLADEALLAATYEPPPHDPFYVDPEPFTGHYIAFHRLLHDVHHRADIIRILTDMDVAVPADRRRRPL